MQHVPKCSNFSVEEVFCNCCGGWDCHLSQDESFRHCSKGDLTNSDDMSNGCKINTKDKKALRNFKSFSSLASMLTRSRQSSMSSSSQVSERARAASTTSEQPSITSSPHSPPPSPGMFCNAESCTSATCIVAPYGGHKSDFSSSIAQIAESRSHVSHTVELADTSPPSELPGQGLYTVAENRSNENVESLTKANKSLLVLTPPSTALNTGSTTKSPAEGFNNDAQRDFSQQYFRPDVFMNQDLSLVPQTDVSPSNANFSPNSIRREDNLLQISDLAAPRLPFSTGIPISPCSTQQEISMYHESPVNNDSPSSYLSSQRSVDPQGSFRKQTELCPDPAFEFVPEDTFQSLPSSTTTSSWPDLFSSSSDKQEQLNSNPSNIFPRIAKKKIAAPSALKNACSVVSAPDTRQYRCPYCVYQPDPKGKRANWRIYLNKHIANKHRSAKLPCEFCGKEISRKDNLAWHKKKSCKVAKSHDHGLEHY